MRSGMKWKSFQHMKIWTEFARYFDSKIVVESKLDPQQLYIFCNFPHGATSANHMLTMTDCCGMLSSVHRGKRVDLAASVLFFVPFLREFVMWLGCVDASAAVANHNLKEGSSVLIYIGGEKEQLLTAPNEHKVFLASRKGFVKLALRHGAHLVPMYAYGENEIFQMSSMAQGLRQWLQHNFKVALPLMYNSRRSMEAAEAAAAGRPRVHPVPSAGSLSWVLRNLYRWDPLYVLLGITLLPNPHVALQIEIGKPMEVAKVTDKEDITEELINATHAKFCTEMHRLFDRTKERHGVDKAVKLQIL